MDRSYLLQQSRSLQDIAVGLFRNIIFEDSQLKPRIVDGACDLIASDRAGEDLDHRTFSETIKMLHEMQTYTNSFEPRMLELSQMYISEWAERESLEKSLADYVASARKLMSGEMARVDMFGLDSTTRRDLLTLLEDHIIQKKETRLSKFSSLFNKYLSMLTSHSQSRRCCRPLG